MKFVIIGKKFNKPIIWGTRTLRFDTRTSAERFLQALPVEHSNYEIGELELTDNIIDATRLRYNQTYGCLLEIKKEELDYV